MTLYPKFNLRNQVPYGKIVSETKNEDKYNPIKQLTLHRKLHLYQNKQSISSRTNVLPLDRSESFEPDLGDIKKDIVASTSKNKTSTRINQLAQPRLRSPVDDTSKKDLVSLSNLIIYETSPRLLELAKPRRVIERASKEPNGIPKRVLKAKASDRIIQLSKPRQSRKVEESNGKKNVNRSFRSRLSHTTNFSIQNSNKKKKKKNLETDRVFFWNKDNDKKIVKKDAISSNSDVSVINVRMKNKNSKNTKLHKKSAKEVKKI